MTRRVGMIELESMAVEMPVVERHPNRVGFRGVLTVVDAPSRRAPSGSNGKRVVLTRAAAEKALPSLIGMALDYAPSYDRHDARRKVGVITSAEIVGKNLEVGGYLYAKDFPEVVREVEKWGGKPSDSARKAFTTEDTEGHIGSQTPHPVAKNATRVGQPHSVAASGIEMHAQSEGARLRTSLSVAVEKLRELTAGMWRGPERRVQLRAETAGNGAGALGMSFEVTNVAVVDKRLRVWILTNVMFTGAAILRRNRAAYEETWIELS
jgi:hypothetical protein